MKRSLRDQYIPLSHQIQMMDEWSQLKQGCQSITNYIAQFQEYIFRCGVEEDEIVTLARFRSGLHEDLRRRCFLKHINTLLDAYDLVQQPENFSTSPKHFDPSPKSYDWSTSMSGSTNNLSKIIQNLKLVNNLLIKRLKLLNATKQITH